MAGNPSGSLRHLKPDATRQTTITLIQLVETVSEVQDGQIAALAVEVRQAEDQLMFSSGEKNRTPLLRGSYLVRAGIGRRLDVKSTSGRVGSREVEVLSYVLTGEFGENWLAQFIVSQKLRVGEPLTDEQKKITVPRQPDGYRT